MKMIDRQYLKTPFFGARKIAACLKSQEVILSIGSEWAG